MCSEACFELGTCKGLRNTKADLSSVGAQAVRTGGGRRERRPGGLLAGGTSGCLKTHGNTVRFGL